MIRSGWVKDIDKFTSSRNYPRPLVVNGRSVEPGDIAHYYNLSDIDEFYPVSATKRRGYGILGLSSHEYPIGENLCGVIL